MKQVFSALYMRFSDLFVLFLLCAVFYTFVHFSAAAAIDKATNIQMLEQITLLRLGASAVFALFLGFVGVKISGRLWPPIFVHSAVVSAMLALDVPFEQLMHNWQITFFIVGLMASLTGVSGGAYLFFLWYKLRR